MMTRGRFFVLSVLVSLITLFASCSRHQVPSPSSVAIPSDPRFGNVISGKVFGEDGQALPGVTVSLESRTGGLLTVFTDDGGKYAFRMLPPDTYAVTFSLQGFTEVRQEDVRIAGNFALDLEVTLRQATSEQVVVTGEAPLIDMRKTSDSITIRPNDPYGIGSGGGAARTKKSKSTPAPTMVNVGANASSASAAWNNASEVVIFATDDEWSQAPAQNETRAASTLEARDNRGKTIGQFPLKHTEVDAEVSGYLARTVLRQEYGNPYRDPIEAVYVFPLPSMAAVNDFLMETGGRRILGIVRAREEA